MNPRSVNLVLLRARAVESWYLGLTWRLWPGFLVEAVAHGMRFGNHEGARA